MCAASRAACATPSSRASPPGGRRRSSAWPPARRSRESDMGYRKLHSSSAGARFATIPDFAEVTKGKPEKTLLLKLKYHAGHNSQGRITCWHKGDRHARQYRVIDFKRAKLDLVGRVAAIEYDPNRNCRIALVQYSNGEK